MSDKNAKMALKQLRMEVAADYGMHYEDAFDIIENAHNHGALSHHFKKLEEKRDNFSGKSSQLE
ncbi:MAG: CD1290 family small acid-soluble spore protein [Romboutsia sp.]|uniref:CD1290 family small acid-soluble spore protein n=1 Tax=Romboutsia sp. TaxID=1965302 RepID=UPI003F403F1D